jgi:pyruvate dehydrogenase E1 component alpha subunit
MAAEKGRFLVKEDKLPGDLGVTTGQEAAEVGALVDLFEDDCVALGRRDLTARFIRNSPLKTIFADLYAQRVGATNGAVRDPQAMIAPAFSLAAQLNLITGVAWSLKRHGRPNVAVAFADDESTSSGFWRDAVDFSALHQLPIVHMVYRSLGAGSVRSGLLAGQNSSVSLPAFTVDGNDVVAVYRVAQEAIRRARQGYGPALIECESCWGNQPNTESEGSGTDGGHPDQPVDPIVRMEAYLQQKGLWSDKWRRRLVESFTRKLDQAVEFAEKSLQRRKRTHSQLANAS